MNEPRSRLIAAFAAIYVVWGSTYLAIRIALEAWPPFLLAGSRFVVAGAALLFLARRAGHRLPARPEWAGSLLTGACLFLLGNGLVCWAEREVASGLAALAVATVPIWMTLLPAPAAHRRSRSGRTWAGVALGLAAVGVLALPGGGLGGAVPPAPLLALLGAALAWSLGSHLSLRLPHPASAFSTAGAQMLCGGAWALLAGTLLGEWPAALAARFTPSRLGAWLYLVVFGSIVALSAYSWLLQHVSPAAVGTYAFVNPVVAVLLGWWLGGEPLGARTLLSLALVVVSVVLILRGRADRPARPSRPGLRAAALLLLALALGARVADAEQPGRGAGESGRALRTLAAAAWNLDLRWDLRLRALAACAGTPCGREALRAELACRGPLVIEAPSCLVVVLEPERGSGAGDRRRSADRHRHILSY